MNWWVYMILTDTNHFYTGITTDPCRSLLEHRDGNTGAKYFRSKKPTAFALLENFADRSLASKREHAIKKLTHTQKNALVIQCLDFTRQLYQTLMLKDLGIPLMSFSTEDAKP